MVESASSRSCTGVRRRDNSALTSASSAANCSGAAVNRLVRLNECLTVLNVTLHAIVRRTPRSSRCAAFDRAIIQMNDGGPAGDDVIRRQLENC